MIQAVVIDSREPDWVQRLTFGGVPSTISALPHGDLMVATEDAAVLLIERKTPDDFLGSLRDGRLFPQLAGMLEQTRWAYLVITGDFQRGQNGAVITERGQTGWSWSAVQGAILSIQEMGVFIQHSAGDMDYEACIQRIAGRERHSDLLLTPPRFPRLLTPPEQVIASLPGIGTDRLQQVMTYCGSAAWALIALTDKTTQIPGIGEGIKERIRQTLGLRNQTSFQLVTDDTGREILTIS